MHVLLYEIDFGEMCIGTKGVGEVGQRGHVPPHFQKCVCVGGGAQTHLCLLPTFRHRATLLETDCQQNLHFFYLYRCYLLLFTELCIDKPNHDQFHTYIVTRVDLL